MLRTSRAAVLSVVALLAVACSTAAPTASPTAAPTPAPTPAPTTPAPTTPAPTATAALSPVELLISYADPDIRNTCHERDRLYNELASITCRPADLPFDYSLFDDAGAMDLEFDYDVAGAETPPQPDGECNQGNYLAPYDFDGRVGRVNCREHTSSSGAQYRVIEWTDENLLVIGYISNFVDAHTWDELIDFWLNQAGPYAP